MLRADNSFSAGTTASCGSSARRTGFSTRVSGPSRATAGCLRVARLRRRRSGLGARRSRRAVRAPVAPATLSSSRVVEGSLAAGRSPVSLTFPGPFPPKQPLQVFFSFVQSLGIVPLTGTTSVRHMREDLDTTERPLPLTEKEVKAIDEALAVSAAQAGRRARG